MRRLDILKTIQLAVFMVLAVFTTFRLLLDNEMSRQFATNPSMRFTGMLLWAVLGISFLFIFLDFSLFSRHKTEFANLKTALSTDPLSHVANRNGCDEIIERYTDKELPEGFAAVMLVLSNIRDTNDKFGRAAGNRSIQEFSVMISTACTELGFVGRNGGNKFLAFFEKSEEVDGKDKARLFIDRINTRVDAYNEDGSNPPLKYAYGVSTWKQIEKKDIYSLITCADNALMEKFD
ncbi:MAG: GGDEF domain-containing protein [Eubacterium sp.]|nr:GGDEF domain-containing protein [Eubacterium sp.]